MILESVNTTDITATENDELFSSVDVDGFSDTVFAAMARCMIYPRLDGKNFNVTVSPSPDEADDPNKYIEYREDGVGCEDAIIFINCSNAYDRVSGAFRGAVIARGYEERSGEENIIKRSYQSRTQLNVMVFRSNEKHITFVVSNKFDLHLQHVYASCIAHFFPWPFIEKPFSEDEIELVRSLVFETEPMKFLQMVKKIYKNLGIRNSRVKAMLSNYETGNIDQQIAREKDRIQELYASIRTYKENIDSALDKIDQVSTMILGYEARLASVKAKGTSPLESIFLKDNISLNSTGHGLDFTVYDYLSYFDRNRAIYLLENKNSSFHIFGMDEELLNALISDVFISRSPRVRIKMCARYLIRNNGSVTAYVMGSETPYGYIENPHISYHRCLGQHERYIVECMEKGNTIAAVLQCVASCGSVNLSEGATASHFVRDILNNKGSGVVCFELPDGSVVNAREAATWLANNKVEENEHEQENEADEE